MTFHCILFAMAIIACFNCNANMLANSWYHKGVGFLPPTNLIIDTKAITFLNMLFILMSDTVKKNTHLIYYFYFWGKFDKADYVTTL